MFFSENHPLIVPVFSENRLMIVHGLMDENVHFLHTSKLVNALVKACKPHTLQVSGRGQLSWRTENSL
ncbi:hypothetical protein DPMN_038542 [Dreissena polymorpha]|uniref:Peptidase S9 prolyl oligopeptidase catalytic domain-containing protein n=1 Tax=Dreissena polymorpha TaxID=45954 RepID=A0A9D4RNR7_DREPO|nr:hypothetical protein DPMN_038542 [Dreissena polymorpha]